MNVSTIFLLLEGIYPMPFDLASVRVLHLEPTMACNAACPLCPRETQTKEFLNHELSLERIQEIIPIEFVKQLTKMFMCGNFGDPAAARDTLKIFKWFKEINPTIELGMNTNGGLRSEKWWTELARLVDFVIFSIDGLEDTNHIYRINVKWKKLIANLSAFIAAGGNAIWDMLVYEHNEHQLAEVESLAKRLGVNRFGAKVSRRPITVDFIHRPTSFTPPPLPTKTINCHALTEKSVYIDARGSLLPCCFIGHEIVNPKFEENIGLKFDNISLPGDYKSIIDSFKVVSDRWDDNPISHCTRLCSIVDGQSRFHNTWRVDKGLQD